MQPATAAAQDAPPVAEVTDGLVARYVFDHIASGRVRDFSGNGYDANVIGNAVLWQGSQGRSLLQLDGKESYVEIPASLGEKCREGRITIALSCRPQEARGGLFGFVTGTGWGDQRCVLAMNTYGGGNSRLSVVGNGQSYQIMSLPEMPAAGQWSHLVMCVDEQTIRVHHDGVMVAAVVRSGEMDFQNVPLWIGRCMGLGKEYFHGLMGDLRVYNRAISEDEVVSLYRQHAVNYQRDTSRFDQPTVEVRLFEEPAWIVLNANCEYMRPLPANGVVVASLHPVGSEAAALEQRVALATDGTGLRIKLDAAALPPGEYEARVHVVADGAPVGHAARQAVRWNGQDPGFKDVRILNNLVWELASMENRMPNNGDTIALHSPKSRWLRVTCSAELAASDALRVSLDDVDAGRNILELTSDAPLGETMRFLPAGDHVLRLEVEGSPKISRLFVRSIPELIYAQYDAEPSIAEYGPFKGELLDDHVLPHVNTLVSSTSQALEDPFVSLWRRRGGRWLAHAMTPGISTDYFETGPQVVSAHEALKYVTATSGYSLGHVDGTIADEFGDSEPHMASYAVAIRRAAQMEPYEGKMFYPYANAMYTGPEGCELIRAVMDTGAAIAWKNYHQTLPDEASARQYLRFQMVDRARQYHQAVPGSMEHVAVCIGYMSAPPEFLSVHPHVNYKTYLDMQFNLIANDPAFWGTYGLMTYLSSYCDDETVRWGARLFRHYGMEGEREPALDDPYVLDHVVNSDFADGTRGWSIAAAAPDSVRPVAQKGLGWLQGRYPRTSVGETALLMIRQASGPNTATQQIRNLEPGRLYSLRLFTADGQDMSRQQQHAVSIRIDGATLLPDESITSVQANSYSHHFGPFNHENNAFVNYHWRVFRADEPTAMLTISDWARDDAPGSEPGQHLLFNFVTVCPYFDQ